MTPQLHDEFVTLCALFYSGELSDEEWDLLQVHLAYCDSCQKIFEQYKQVNGAAIPAMAAAAAAGSASTLHESASAFADAENRLLRKLEVVPTPQQKPAEKKPSWGLGAGTLAACVIVFAALAHSYWVRESAERQSVPAPQLAPKTSSSPPAVEAKNDDSVALQQSQEELTKLRQQISALESRSTQPDSATTTLEHQLQAEQLQQEQLASEKQTLTTQLASAQSNIQALRDQLSSATSNADKQAAQVTTLEAKVRSLNVSLEETNSALDDRERMLALDKDFLAHDRDIRDLIGARDLYIADIFDTTESGKTAKPFGRIFYTRDRSLAFYGFDLDKQPGLKQSVAFQAWGSGSDSQPVNLGLFYQDDSHKRWVLRFNDAKTLARLNMVFVTVEPPGGSNKPTGKQLLRAYLQIQPNHP